MRVAESIVILGPMRHVGWARASSRVMRSKLSRERLRNGAAGGGEDQPAHVFGPAAVEALVEGAVLAVDGQEPGAGLPRPGEHELPGHHQRLLVRERDVLARLERAVGRHEAQGAHRGGDHHVRLGPGRHLDHALAAGHGAQAREVHEAGEPLEGTLVGDRHDPRPVPRHLLRQDLDVRRRRRGPRPRSGPGRRPPPSARSCRWSRSSRGWRGLSWGAGLRASPHADGHLATARGDLDCGGALSARTESNSTGPARRTASCRAGRACRRGRGRASPSP